MHKMTREKVPFKCTLMVKLGPWAGGVCNCAHWGSFYAKDNDMSLCSTPHKLCKMHDMNGVRKPSRFSRFAFVLHYFAQVAPAGKVALVWQGSTSLAR